MSTLYIDRQGTQLTVNAGVLRVENPGNDTGRSIPLKYLERIVMRAETHLSSKVLSAIADAGVHMVALGGRGGQQIAQMVGAPHSDARKRWQQVLLLSQPQVCCGIARNIVHSKVKRQQATLRVIGQNRPDLRKPMFDGQQRLGRILETLSELGLDDSAHLNQIRGLEGAAAAHYFEAFFTAFAPALGATGRNRRPPRDPVNAVLSLSYTLLYSQAVAACWCAGLDPALGALHTLSHGRGALACDLMEPYRPMIDLWVWEQFRTESLRPEHFGQDGSGACLLGKAGRGYFYAAWEQKSQLLQRSILRYARAFSKTFSQNEADAVWGHLAEETNVMVTE
jgi:CRISPR-associated protein Cas1